MLTLFVKTGEFDKLGKATRKEQRKYKAELMDSVVGALRGHLKVLNVSTHAPPLMFCALELEWTLGQLYRFPLGLFPGCF